MSPAKRGRGAAHAVGLAKQRSRPPVVAPKVMQQLAALEEAIGGRDALVAALLHAPKSRDLQYLLGVIAGEGGPDVSLAQLCAIGGVTPGEVIEAYKAGEINRAQALATRKVGAKLAEVAEDTMRVALPHQITCLECEGLGQVASEDGPPQTCTTCHGRGHHPTEGDLEHKKLALEMGKLLQKGGGGGVNVNVQQNTGLFLGSAGGALEKLQEATDRILFGEGGQAPEDVVEGEVTPPDAEDADLVAESMADLATMDPDDDGDAATLDTDWQGHPL